MFGAPLQVPSPSLLLHTDASLLGWGAHLLGLTAHLLDLWSKEESSLHISVLEIMAVSQALAAFLPQLSGQSVVAYLWNQGSTVYHVMCRMAAKVVLWTKRHSISLTARYILGKKNVLADQLSHPNQVLTFFLGYSRRFVGCLVVLILNSLSLMPMPSFLCTCIRFRTQ